MPRIRFIEAREGAPLPSRVKIFKTTAIRNLKTVHAAYKALYNS